MANRAAADGADNLHRHTVPRGDCSSNARDCASLSETTMRDCDSLNNKRIAADHLAGLDAHAQGPFRAADAALSQRHCQAAVGHIMGRDSSIPSRSRRRQQFCTASSILRSIHGGVPRRQAMNRFQIFAAAQFFPGPAEQHDHVAGAFEPRRHDPIDFFEQPDHADGRRRMNRHAVGFVIETDVAAHHRNVEARYKRRACPESPRRTAT